MPSPSKSSGFEREVASRFGLIPNFFVSAPDAPEIIEKLWDFAKSGYLDNPIPALFKERLFVYLSRFCEVRYCILRHCGFLLGYGRSSGDPTADPQTVAQAIRLLKKEPPWSRNSDAWLSALESGPPCNDWPGSDTELEDHIFAAATMVFVQPGRSDRARRALWKVLGGKRYEYLLGLLAFIRTAHYWTVNHPQLAPEEDVESYLRLNEELARLLLEDPEVARCDMGSRLFAELEDLRDLNERRELESLLAQKELLLREVNHRVRNSLQMVSSILHLQTKTVSAEAAAEMRTASARILAIAAVHERLYTGSTVATVTLDSFLKDLCADIGKTLRSASDLEVELVAVEVPTDKAVPLALIVNELVTNAIKYGKPPCCVETRKGIHDTLTLTVSDRGNGPAQNHKRGLGSRIVDAFVQQLGAKVTTIRNANCYAIEVEIPIGLTGTAA